MLKLGYKLMSEEHGPLALVHNGRRAEQAGFKDCPHGCPRPVVNARLPVSR